jgi:hypothetical protein
MKIKGHIRATLAVLATVIAAALKAVADIPAPKVEATGTNWGFVAVGAICAFVGVLAFLWVGRKLVKKA